MQQSRHIYAAPGQRLYPGIKKLGCFREPGHPITANRRTNSRCSGHEVRRQAGSVSSAG